MKRDWFQIFTNLGVILGLIVLVYQINQSHQQAEAQMVVESIQTSFASYQLVVGENPAPVLAKARSKPAELTFEERVVLDAFNRSVLLDVAMRYWMADIGIWNTDGAWRGLAVSHVNQNLAYPAGREWWSRNRDKSLDGVRALVDEGIQRGDSTTALLAPYTAQ